MASSKMPSRYRVGKFTLGTISPRTSTTKQVKDMREDIKLKEKMMPRLKSHVEKMELRKAIN
jgi:hypothetical protein